jgi:aminopeptidase
LSALRGPARAETWSAEAHAIDQALGLTELRYAGDGTNLSVGLLPNSRWAGGGLMDANGFRYLPNIPTEEVFTSLDRHRADGMIRVTKPVVVSGQLVTGLRVIFEGGRITEVSASEGAEVVRAQLEADNGARHLGEVSLVEDGNVGQESARCDG